METEKHKIKQAFKQAKASMEMEGHVFTKEDDKAIMDVLTGKITREQLIKKIRM